MKLSLALPLLLAAAALPFLPPVPRAAAAAAQEDSPLSGMMGDLGGSVRKLKEIVGDETTIGGALDEVCRLQKLAIDVKGEVPSTVSSIEDEKKRERARVEYRLQVQELVRALLDLEAAVLEKDGKKANKALREVEKAKDAGHSRFKPKD